MRLACAFLLSLGLIACTGDDDDDGSTDAGQTDTGNVNDTGPRDTGGQVDSGPNDTGVNPDGGNPDMGMPDSGDAGVPPTDALRPGDGVTFSGVNISIGTDTFSSVNTKLAAATRTRISPDTGRSYDYEMGGQTITVWFANTNLDGDDQAPNDVDDTDAVLWIAVADGFVGSTPDGVDLDDTDAEVVAAYGAAPNTLALTMPAGTLAQYYTQGFLAAYEPNGDLRTLTICRAYPTEPNGALDPNGARIDFGGSELKGFVALGDVGTDKGDVRTLLGEPDAEGQINLAGTNLDTLSYAFIGLEVFYTTISDNTAFFTVHAPYYGTFNGTLGLGSTKTELDTYLTGLGYTVNASSNAQLFCYESGGMPNVGVTYSMTNEASSITIPLLQCP